MRVLAASIILAVLAGCAPDPWYKEGLSWVTWQEEERQRMEKQGFPQYGPGY